MILLLTKSIGINNQLHQQEQKYKKNQAKVVFVPLEANLEIF